MSLTFAIFYGIIKKVKKSKNRNFMIQYIIAIRYENSEEYLYVEKRIKWNKRIAKQFD